MVYNGKPSRGCENCRNLRVKCDEKLPECSRCSRMRRKCTGFQNRSDIIFRDENARTRERAKRASKGTQAKSWNLTIANDPQSYLSFGLSLSPSVEDIAICQFYHATLENLAHEDPARYLHTQLPGLYHRSEAQSALFLATQAISYASSVRFGRKTARISRVKYSQAVKAVEKAIRCPVEARKDETLYAVLLLCGYETIMCDSEELLAWGIHVDGAAALLRIRGSEALSLPLSRSMFCFVRKNIILSHMQTSRPIPLFFTEQVSTTDQYENVEDQLISKTTRIPQVQYYANSLLSHSDCKSRKSSIEQLLSTARILDRDLSDWANNAPISWRYSTAINVHPSTHSGFIPRHIHRYSDFYTARVWNLFRVSRLIVQSILLRAVTRVANSSSRTNPKNPSITNIEDTIRELVNDICASVSFLLGNGHLAARHPIAQKPSSNNTSWPKPSSRSKDTLPKSSGRFSLIWPLHIGSSASSIPDDQRRWMRTQLSLIAEGGEPQALSLCDRESQTLSGGIEAFRFDCV